VWEIVDCGVIRESAPERSVVVPIKPPQLKAVLLPTAAALIVLVLALALGGTPVFSSTTSAQTSAVVTSSHTKVKIYMFAFEPSKLTVKAGTRITFTNYDMTAHTATALNESFDTGTIQPGQSRTIVIMKAGVYPFHCLFHAFMTGTIKVVG
jgi:plastocyanin